MNYKAIFLCAVIGASMQSAWGMDEEEKAADSQSLASHVALKFEEAQAKQTQVSPKSQRLESLSNELDLLRKEVRDNRKDFDATVGALMRHEMSDDGDGSIKVNEAMVGGSMHSVRGMDEERAKIQAIKAKNDADCRLIIEVMTDERAYNSIDRSRLAELTVRIDSGDLKRRAIECTAQFAKAKEECDKIGVDMDTDPVFKDVAAKMKSLTIIDTTEAEDALINELKVAFVKGDIAKDLDAAREKHLGKE